MRQPCEFAHKAIKGGTAFMTHHSKRSARRRGDNEPSGDCLGILFGRDVLEGCRATRSLFGSVRYQRATAAQNGRSLSETLSELLTELGVDKLSLPIAAALPTDDCYFATRPTASGSQGASPKALLRESMRSHASRLDKMAIDVLHWQPDRRPVAGIVAAPTEIVDEIRCLVAETGHSLQRLEPAASCLVAAAAIADGRERSSQLTTRVLLGQASLLAVISRGRRAIQWQRLPLPAGDEATGIVSAIRSLETAASACGLDRTPDKVVMHGRNELHALIDQQWLTDNLPKDHHWVESPGLRPSDVAQSLADQLLVDDDEGFDLVRQHRDPIRLGRVVPYKEVAAYVAIALALVSLIWMRLDDARAEQTSLITTAPPMVASQTNLTPQRNEMKSRAGAVTRLLEKRVRWSAVFSDVLSHLPEGTRLTEIHGSSPMLVKKSKKIKSVPTTLVLKGETVLDDQGRLPSELDNLAKSIQQIDSVEASFKSVELKDVRRIKSQKTGVSGAQFSLIFTNPMGK